MADTRRILPSNWHDRVLELRRLRPSEMDDHPLQWKIHTPHQQRLMRGLLEDVGIAGVGLAYVSPSTGRMTSIDGHLRKSLGDVPWPTIILDVTDAQAATLLVTYDEVARLIDADSAQLTATLAAIDTESQAVLDFLTSVALDYKAIPPESFADRPATQAPGRPGTRDRAEDFDTGPVDGDVPGSNIHMVQLFLEEADYPAFKQACDRLAPHYQTRTVTETVLACVMDTSARLAPLPAEA